MESLFPQPFGTSPRNSPGGMPFISFKPPIGDMYLSKNGLLDGDLLESSTGLPWVSSSQGPAYMTFTHGI